MQLTKYKKINTLLQKMLFQIQSILAEKFVGMYIGGSLASNSFHFETSDIDCYVVTTTTLSKDFFQKIEDMHKQFYCSNLSYAKKIEISYIPQKDLLNFNNPSKFTSSDYQAFAILTMCRTLYSLETGRITSKMKAANWVLKKIDTHWKNLIGQALLFKPEQEINKLEETQEFIRYVIYKSREN